MSVKWTIHDYVEIEHQVIRDGFNELLTITSVKSTEKLKLKTEEIPFEDLSGIPTGNKAEGKDFNETENKESTECQTWSDKEDKHNAQEREEITFEEQAEKANIKISFTQLSQFKSTTELVTFILYILVSDQINKGLEIKLFYNLINVESEEKMKQKKYFAYLKKMHRY